MIYYTQSETLELCIIYTCHSYDVAASQMFKRWRARSLAGAQPHCQPTTPTNRLSLLNRCMQNDKLNAN